MKTSKLKYDMDAMKLKHDYELKTLQMSQKFELEQLIDTCNHKWDDGSSASGWNGMQHNGWNSCSICGKSL